MVCPVEHCVETHIKLILFRILRLTCLLTNFSQNKIRKRNKHHYYFLGGAAVREVYLAYFNWRDVHKNQTTDKYVNHTIYGGKGYVASNVVESA